MATLLAGDKVLLTVTGVLLDQRIMMTFPYLCTEIGSSVQQDDAFTAFRNKLCEANGFMDKLMSVVPQNLTAIEMWFQVLWPVRWNKFIKTSTAAGGRSDDVAVTPNLAQVITRRADRSGRKYRGSVHIPFAITSENAANGVIDAGQLTLLGAFAGKVATEIVTASPTIHFAPSLFHRPISADPDPVTEAFPQATVRVMRRRTVGLGI